MEAPKLTREELYELVWSEPMQTAAKRFGISDVALAKNCRRMLIPLPGRGYWAKKAAGHKVKRSSLPAIPANSALAGRNLVFEPSPVVKHEEPVPVAAQITFEDDPANQIVVPAVLRTMHPLVRATRVALEVDGTKHRERPWNRNARYLDLDVTKAELRRALRIANALINAFEARGWQVALGTGDDRKTYAVVLGQRVPFSIRETIKKVENPPAEPRRLPDGTIYTPWQNKYRDEASGLLALVIRNSWGHGVEKSFVETTTRPLEDRLNDFVIAVMRKAHEEAERERHRREEAQRRLEAEELERAEEQRREVEAARIAALEQQALDWETSTRLRRYLAAVRGRAEGDLEAERPESPLRQWLEWAEDYARCLDPLSLPIIDLPLLTLNEED